MNEYIFTQSSFVFIIHATFFSSIFIFTQFVPNNPKVALDAYMKTVKTKCHVIGARTLFVFMRI